jgi:hypothetical protein
MDDPSWWWSVTVWATAVVVDLAVPLSMRGVEVTRCMDGYSDLGSFRAAVVVMIVPLSAYGLWRAVRHLYAGAGRGWRWVVAVVVALAVGAVVGVLAGFMVLNGITPKLTLGGGC